MKDLIHIKGLRLRTWIGVAAWEQRDRQDLVVDITIRHDQRKAAQTDEVEHTVDYRKIRDDVVAFAREERHKLIETFAQDVADIALRDPLVESVKVQVEKPHALRFSDAVAVEIERSR